jgi:hypothetical protein
VTDSPPGIPVADLTDAQLRASDVSFRDGAHIDELTGQEMEPGELVRVPCEISEPGGRAMSNPTAAEAAAIADEFFGREPGTAARLLGAELSPDPEIAHEQAMEILDEWDSADSAAYQARVEAGIEPEVEP